LCGEFLVDFDGPGLGDVKSFGGGIKVSCMDYYS